MGSVLRCMWRNTMENIRSAQMHDDAATAEQLPDTRYGRIHGTQVVHSTGSERIAL